MPTDNSKPGAPHQTPPAPTGTYAAAYAQLATIAERLKAGGTISIDTLVDDVRAARAAHDACRQRLAAVRAEIDQDIAAAAEDTADAP